MRRRFGRGRRKTGTGEGRNAPIDAELWLGRIVESQIADGVQLEVVSREDVPESYAALGQGTRDEGGEVLVGFSPRSGGDALLAVLALARQRAASGDFSGELVAVAPHWSSACRRRLALVGELPFVLRPLAAPSLGEGQETETPEPAESMLTLGPRRIAGFLKNPQDRDLFLRALAAFEGLAAKHGGAVRGVGTRVELVLMARCVAALSEDRGRVGLETLLPERSSQTLSVESLSSELDRLEGSLRKRLNDRRIRGGEEGLRSSLLPILARASEVVKWVCWPLAGSDPEVIDIAGFDAAGGAVVGAVRKRMTLPVVGEILDACLAVPPTLAAILAESGEPLRPGLPQLVLAAEEFEAAPLEALSALHLGQRLFDVGSRRGGELTLERREADAATAPKEKKASPPRRRRPSTSRRAPVESAEGADAESPGAAVRSQGAAPESPGAGIEEISLFDLDEGGESQAGEEEAVARPRRGRGRRRGRGSRGARESESAAASEAEPSEEPPRDAAAASPRESSRRSRRREAPSSRAKGRGGDEAEAGEEADDSLVDEDDTLAPLADVASDLEEPAAESYEEEETEEGDAEGDLARRERELRRRARIAKMDPVVEPEPPRKPRRRAAFVAHADRASIFATMLLARDVRLIEGFWVYPQEELMTFFRSVATDLREGTPIFLVGFTASPPARDTLQAASLYRGRLDWFDYHEWPPEDLLGLRDAIGEDRVHVETGGESPLSAVLVERTRRSRFSDKLVELATGRFSQHDYERWGRLWWHRIGELASRPGERRADIDALLTGRPSDLAREAERVPAPPLPPELEYVSRRDFRLVHFGGYTMVVIDVAPELSLHLASRIARERYEAQLSLAYHPDSEFVILAGDEGRAKRGLDLGGMTEHLASKHEWVEALPDADHVARMRVRNLWSEPDRLDGVIAEIAMGRAIIEG